MATIAMSESRLVNAILSLAAYLSDVRLYRNNNGTRGRVRFGLQNRQLKTGSPDIVGAVAGRFVGLEVKMPGEEASAAQKKFMADIRDGGGFACVVDSVRVALDAIERARDWSKHE